MASNKTDGRFLPLAGAIILAAGVWLGYCLADGDKTTETQRKLAKVLEIINDEYVDEIDIDSVVEGAIPILMSNLDPHSVYISAADRATANQRLDGSFSGIGIQFQQLNDSVCVVEVIAGGPSERAGLMPGDRIIAAGDSILTGPGINADDVRNILRGPQGSEIEVSVVRHGVDDVLKFKIVRNAVPIESIDAAYMVDDNIGYLKVNTFGRNTYAEFLQEIYALDRSGAEAYIIDLRGNVGGYMDPAIMMVNEFLPPNSVIVATKGRNEKENSVVLSDGTGNFDDVPLVVLIDEFSASSSEIFSGAIQDNDRGLIVGRRSFGKGLVQRPFELPDSSEIRLTVQRYYTPSGRCIQKDFVRGDNEGYEAEILERYNHGENFTADSAHIVIVSSASMLNHTETETTELYVEFESNNGFNGDYTLYMKEDGGAEWVESYMDLSEVGSVGEIENDYSYFIKTNSGFKLNSEKFDLYLQDAIDDLNGVAGLNMGSLKATAEYNVYDGKLSTATAVVSANFSADGTNGNVKATTSAKYSDFGTTVVSVQI